MVANKPRAAVFLDRDGVIIRDTNLACRIEDVDLYPYAPAAIQALRRAGFLLVVVTNQPVVARGLATLDDVHRIHRFIGQQLARAGAAVDRFCVCPHHPQADLPQFRQDCDCRKPKPGMLLQAAQELNIDLAASFMVGDRLSDIVAGRLAGCRTIQVRTGQHAAPPIQTTAEVDWSVPADYVCADIARAVPWILQNSGESTTRRSAIRTAP